MPLDPLGMHSAFCRLQSRRAQTYTEWRGGRGHRTDAERQLLCSRICGMLVDNERGNKGKRSQTPFLFVPSTRPEHLMAPFACGKLSSAPPSTPGDRCCGENTTTTR